VVVLAVVAGMAAFGFLAASELRSSIEGAATLAQPGAWTWNPFASGTPKARPLGTAQKVRAAEITVHGSRESDGTGFMPPSIGDKWLIVDVSPKNTGNGAYVLSSSLECKLRDDRGRSYFVAVEAPITGSFDGMMQSGGVLSGEVAFEVPEDATGLVFIFQPVFGFDQAAWSLEATAAATPQAQAAGSQRLRAGTVPVGALPAGRRGPPLSRT
jgi:hypothetical protein